MEDRLLEVHRYWFGDSENDHEVIQQKGKLWFGKDAVVDRYIRETFGDLIDLAGEGSLDMGNGTPRQRLSVILLIDQFRRNVYRNDPRSFDADPLARELAGGLCLSGSESLRPIEKVFLYLPFEHSELIADQKKSIALFRGLLENSPPETRDTYQGFYDYAVRHYEIVARFGRFPHRNSILGRKSSLEELDFLKQPGSSF